jgi:hypothetical protein
MAKRTDIGRGFAAVMNHPEPGPTVFRMARGILREEGKAMPCALYIPTAGGIGCFKLAASDLEHPEKFQKIFDANPRRCAAVQVGGLPNNLVEGDQDAFLLGAGEVDTFSGAFTIDETRTLMASGLDPDSLVAKGKRTKQPLAALGDAILERYIIFSGGREGDETFGEEVPPLQPPSGRLRAAVRQTMRHVHGDFAFLYFPRNADLWGLPEPPIQIGTSYLSSGVWIGMDEPARHVFMRERGDILDEEGLDPDEAHKRLGAVSREQANLRGPIYISTDSLELFRIMRGAAFGEDVKKGKGPQEVPLRLLQNYSYRFLDEARAVITGLNAQPVTLRDWRLYGPKLEACLQVLGESHRQAAENWPVEEKYKDALVSAANTLNGIRAIEVQSNPHGVATEFPDLAGDMLSDVSNSLQMIGMPQPPPIQRSLKQLMELPPDELMALLPELIWPQIIGLKTKIALEVQKDANPPGLLHTPSGFTEEHFQTATRVGYEMAGEVIAQDPDLDETAGLDHSLDQLVSKAMEWIAAPFEGLWPAEFNPDADDRREIHYGLRFLHRQYVNGDSFFALLASRLDRLKPLLENEEVAAYVQGLLAESAVGDVTVNTEDGEDPTSEDFSDELKPEDVREKTPLSVNEMLIAEQRRHIQLKSASMVDVQDRLANFGPDYSEEDRAEDKVKERELRQAIAEHEVTIASTELEERKLQAAAIAVAPQHDVAIGRPVTRDSNEKIVRAIDSERFDDKVRGLKSRKDGQRLDNAHVIPKARIVEVVSHFANMSQTALNSAIVRSYPLIESVRKMQCRIAGREYDINDYDPG